LYTETGDENLRNCLHSSDIEAMVLVMMVVIVVEGNKLTSNLHLSNVASFAP
jgi:hypothetical protein